MHALIVEDERMFSDLLAKACLNSAGFRTVRQTSSIREATSVLRTEHVDAVLLDVRLPDGCGLTLCTRQMKQNQSGCYIVLSAFWDEWTIYRAVTVPIKGLIDKCTETVDSIREATALALAGGRFMSPSIAAKWSSMERDPRSFVKVLSPRELHILDYISQAFSNENIGKTFHLSPTTVQWHRKQIMWKLGIHSSPELLMYAHSLGFGNDPLSDD
jgi:DNA-binding NarL/FixJ family response regulator